MNGLAWIAACSMMAGILMAITGSMLWPGMGAFPAFLIVTAAALVGFVVGVVTDD